MTNTPNPDTRPARGRLGTRRSRLAVAIAGMLAVATIGAASGVAAARTVAVPPSEAGRHRTGPDLGELTLDRLGDRLAELGLVLEIVPAGGERPGDDAADAAGPWDDGWDDEGWGDEPAPLGIFTVDGDRLEAATNVRSGVSAEAEAIWGRFTELIPADQRRMVARFELLARNVEGAYVAPVDEDPTTWVLGVARGLGDDLDAVLIHEFGHLLTLQASQVPPDPDAVVCTTYFTGEGCALSTSTMNRFVERFWPAEMRDEAARIEELGDWDAAEAFLQRHRDEFVTEYASTNPGEDLAETFAVFVLEDRPDGATVADEKIRFLWDDPAMVELRSQIRDRGGLG